MKLQEVHTSRERLYVRDKLTGRAVYGADMHSGGMLYAKGVCLGCASARIHAIRTEECLAVPGVLAVFTAKDLPGKNGFGLFTDDEPILAADTVKFTGDVVALVVAESREAAAVGAGRIYVELTPLHPVLTIEEALQSKAVIHPDYPDNICADKCVRKGDADSALDHSEILVDETYTTSWIEHAYLEPEVMAVVPQENGRLEIRGAMQHPFLWMAGGTELLVQGRNSDRFAECAVFDLTAIAELQQIREQADCLEIGSMATHAEIATSPLVKQYAPILAQACAQVGACQLRNRATIGGNIANASPAGDTLGPLTALDAEVVLDELGACRTMPVTELIAAPGKTILQEREFIRSIRLPKLEKGSQSCFFKVGRRSALAISRLTLSLLLTVNGDGTVKEMRAAIGAVFPRPVRFRELEYTLVEKN